MNRLSTARRAEVVRALVEGGMRSTVAHCETGPVPRDAHEVEAHAYRHEPTPNASWGFERKFSRNGRSTMGRR